MPFDPNAIVCMDVMKLYNMLVMSDSYKEISHQDFVSQLIEEIYFNLVSCL